MNIYLHLSINIIYILGGGSASLVAQTIIVPVDVVSQRLMMIGQTVNIDRSI